MDAFELARARAAVAKGVNMKAAIIGANGIIGNSLYHTLLPTCTECIGLTSQSTPPLVTVSYALSSLQEFMRKSDIIIYCIGVSKFAECEASPEKSLYLNADLPKEILKNLSPRQKFIYLSSPIALYDFKGKKPYNYALHKQCAEDIILHSGHDNFLIIRPSRIIESTTSIKEWKQKLSEGHTITPFFDYFISPITAAMLSGQILRLIQDGHSGCYNFSAQDRISYLDIARELCAHFGLDEALIEKKSAQEHNPFFFRQDILDCTDAGKATGYIPPFSKDIIFDYFQKLA